MIRTIIASCGGYLPKKILTNADLEKMVDTSDEWIVQRTGIKERRIAAEGETTSDMAAAAARDALERGGFTPADIDGIIVATTTPDKTCPSVAVHVQAALGVPPCVAFDVQAVCSGFVYALSVADKFIATGQNKRMLVIGADKMSSIMNWQDRGTCVLFGDGAGAVIVEADANGTGLISDRGILSTHLYAEGQWKDILGTNGGVATTQAAGTLEMDGPEVFKHAVRYLAAIVEETLQAHNLEASAIDWLVPHQANTRIIEGTARKLGLPMEQVVLTVARHGNTSAASVPLALAEAVNSGQIKRGDLLLMEALGAGLTWGAVLARF